MYRDYDSEHGAAVETIPGFRRLFDFGGKVHGIWGYSSSQDETKEEYIIVHAGTKLFAFKAEERDMGKYEVCYEGLNDSKSSAFLQNNRFYICVGTGIYVLYPDTESEKTFKVVSLEEEAYVPITYVSGGTYEQRNMLTDKFINRDTAVVTAVWDEWEYDGGINVNGNSDGSGVNGSGMDWYDYKKKIGILEEDYNKNIIHSIEFSRKLDELDITWLQRFYHRYEDSNGYSHTQHYTISKEFVENYLNFIGESRVKRLLAKYDVSDEIKAYFDECYIGDNRPIYDRYQADVVIYDPCIEINKVTVAGKEIPEYNSDGEDVPNVFYLPVKEKHIINGGDKWYVSFIHIYSSERYDLDTKEVDIYGVAEGVKVEKVASVTAHTDYLTSNTEYKGTSKDAILGCSISATFDGRVFLTGNPKLPNTVFYSCRDLTGYNNPTYFGVYNYFNDGTDNAPNVAMLATSSVLMVLKGNTLHGSSIYYHTAADGIDDVVPRIYPSTPGVAGLGCVGEALNFLDDAVFISDRGVEGVSKEALNLERTIGHRSSNIDRMIREGNKLNNSRLCRFGGYLCLFDGMGNIYLGDSRAMFQSAQGSVEYEWYCINDVFCYENHEDRFKTLTNLPEIGGYTITELIEDANICVAEESEYVDFSDLTYDTHTVNGAELKVYYVWQNGKKIICDSDGELEGCGEAYPACVGYSANGLLFFGTTGGQVCCFNTDKRGESYGTDLVEADRIHRSWYTFEGRKYNSSITLKSDNCGVPHLTKRTTRKTCVIKLKSMQGSQIDVFVRTDREAYEKIENSLTGTMFDFGDVNFENFTFATETDKTVVVKEKKKKWVEKQFTIESNGYMAPFGLYSLTYNYEIQGRIKK
jgi:hypothetical protein